MYDFRDINKLLNNVENLIPQIVAAIVALTALIGTSPAWPRTAAALTPATAATPLLAMHRRTTRTQT